MKPPKKIMIMADYGCSYAWTDCSDCIAYYFEDHPRYAEIEAIEMELEKWAHWFNGAEMDDPAFPWTEFNDKGIELGSKLAEILADRDVIITYQKPYEDPDGKENIEIILPVKKN